jgi:hypothetical protein
VVPSDTRAALAEHPGVLVRGERRVGVRVEGGVVLELEDRGLASLGPIRVGLTVDGIDLSADVRLGRVTRRTVSGDWVARSGKATGPHSYSHDELVVELDRHDGLGWELHVRLADDGFAFRAVMPVLAGHHRLDSDDTGSAPRSRSSPATTASPCSCGSAARATRATRS